jgi:hypothetical protein
MLKEPASQEVTNLTLKGLDISLNATLGLEDLTIKCNLEDTEIYGRHQNRIFARSDVGIVGSNPTQSMDVYGRLCCSVCR